jgi:hypothetical protein
MRPAATASDYSRWLRYPGKEKGIADDQPAPRGDIEVNVRQQKSEDKDAISDLFLKHTDARLAIYV